MYINKACFHFLLSPIDAAKSLKVKVMIVSGCKEMIAIMRKGIRRSMKLDCAGGFQNEVGLYAHIVKVKHHFILNVHDFFLFNFYKSMFWICLPIKMGRKHRAFDLVEKTEFGAGEVVFLMV